MLALSLTPLLTSPHQKNWQSATQLQDKESLGTAIPLIMLMPFPPLFQLQISSFLTVELFAFFKLQNLKWIIHFRNWNTTVFVRLHYYLSPGHPVPVIMLLPLLVAFFNFDSGLLWCFRTLLEFCLLQKILKWKSSASLGCQSGLSLALFTLPSCLSQLEPNVIFGGVIICTITLQRPM
jgi:hypothetical protein